MQIRLLKPVHPERVKPIRIVPEYLTSKPHIRCRHRVSGPVIFRLHRFTWAVNLHPLLLKMKLVRDMDWSIMDKTALSLHPHMMTSSRRISGTRRVVEQERTSKRKTRNYEYDYESISVSTTHVIGRGNIGFNKITRTVLCQRLKGQHSIIGESRWKEPYKRFVSHSSE